ncbi:MAG: hypothetical protein AAFR24_17820 [Cyanobacteria bacterium J06627_3]
MFLSHEANLKTPDEEMIAMQLAESLRTNPLIEIKARDNIIFKGIVNSLLFCLLEPLKYPLNEYKLEDLENADFDEGKCALDYIQFALSVQQDEQGAQYFFDVSSSSDLYVAMVQDELIKIRESRKKQSSNIFISLLVNFVLFVLSIVKFFLGIFGIRL